MTHRWVMLLLLLLLSSCHESETSREEARFQREVSQRVEAIRTEMKISESRWHTVRIVAFSLLAGGSLIWLFNGGGTSSGRGFSPLADGKEAESTTRRRVIDRPFYDPDDESDPYSLRR